MFVSKNSPSETSIKSFEVCAVCKGDTRSIAELAGSDRQMPQFLRATCRNRMNLPIQGSPIACCWPLQLRFIFLRSDPRLSRFQIIAMIYLFAIFLLLIAGWMLLAWMIGESYDIRWLRNWCAGIFVVMAICICTGGGFYLTYKMLRSTHRQSIQQMAKLLKERLDEGRTSDVRDAIEHLASDPPEGSGFSPDILQRMTEVTQALDQTRHSNVASRPESLH